VTGPILHRRARVEDQVEGDLPDLVGVDGDRGQARGELPDERHVVQVQVVGGEVHDLLEERVEVGRLQRRPRRAGVAQEVLDDPLAALALVPDVPDVLPVRVGGVHLVLEVPGVSEDHREGC
jgi:hypothetical protein